MGEKSAPLADRIREYYQATDRVYLNGWAKGESRGFHFGLADDHTESLEESLINTNRFLAERSAVTQDSYVLDAGCGVGGSALWLAKNYGARVVGVTLVQGQVDVARELARERSLEGSVQFECMDMTATSFLDDSFDVIWSLESLVHVIDVEACLRHMAAILREGGRFACIHYCRTEHGDEELLKEVENGWALAPLISQERVLHAMEAAGFGEIEHVDLTVRAMPSARAMRAMASKTLLALRADREFLGKEEPAYEAHVRAALAIVDALERGHLTLSHFRGVRPSRR